MGILNLLPGNKKKERERIRIRQGDPESAPASAQESEEILDLAKNLVRDESIAPHNALNAATYFGEKKVKDRIKTTSVFFYGKVWFYNAVLEILLGPDWNKSKEIQIVNHGRTLSTATQASKKAGRPLVILPSVHDQDGLNRLVSKALETKRPVWFIGYPSTLSKHLLVSFQSFIVCAASNHESDILSDVAELSQQDMEFLKQQKSAVFISKGSAQSIHLSI